jgi:hypothetical protein
LVVYCETAIHYHGNPCLLQLTSNLRMANAHLHPNQLRSDFEQLLQQSRDILRAAENIHDVDGTGRGPGGAEIGIYRLTQGHASSRVDRDDGVARALEIRGHAVTGSVRLSAESDHGDATGVSDELR